MSWSYEPASGSDRDFVRLLINDIDDSDEDNHYFEDEEIDNFLSREGNDPKLAAAQALDTLASSEALIQKKIRILDLSTDGPAVAKELRERAAMLRDQVYTGDDQLPDWAEMVLDAHTLEERLFKEAQRD